MIAASELTNRARVTAAPGVPKTADEVLLNQRLVAQVLAVSETRCRAALSAVVPCCWDGNGHPLFKATRLHEFARLLESPKAGTSFQFLFGKPGAEPTRILIHAPK